MLRSYFEVIGKCKQLTISLFVLVILKNALVDIQQEVD